jgi:hypothetical protein
MKQTIRSRSATRRRRPIVAVAVALLASTAAACGSDGLKHTSEQTLSSLDALTCDGYLAWDAEPVRHVLLWMNGSGNGSSAWVQPMADSFLRARPAAWVGFDRPGIHAPFGNPGARQIEDAALMQYTQGHLVACARNALLWARDQFGADVRFQLRGHSEGSLIAVALYAQLLEEELDLATRIDNLFLTGVSLEPVADAFARQLADLPGDEGERLRQAYAACDWPVMRDAWGLSCAYLEDARSRPSGRAIFETLAAAGAPAHVVIFHGTEDWNAPVSLVQELEAWNQNTGTLNVEFHYYQGGHMATDAVRTQLLERMLALVPAN